MTGSVSLYQVDAFSGELFGGNPAAVCPLQAWPDDAWMQAVAAENNLAETAFLVREADGLRIRWFTPTTEVDLCGHATLATAFVHFHALGGDGDTVTFASRSGPLSVRRDGKRLTLDFPALPPTPVTTPPAELFTGLGIDPAPVLAAKDYLVVLEHADAVRKVRPYLPLLASLTEKRGVIVTAPGDDCDFVSRFFAPHHGIDEDPVTGSAHCTLTPYWTDRLGRDRLHARQLSARGGELFCSLHGDRVHIGGQAALYLRGSITAPPARGD